LHFCRQQKTPLSSPQKRQIYWSESELTGFKNLQDFYPDNPIILTILIQTTGTKKPPLSFQKGGFCFIRDAS
jgi:hypothetical protein